jgi:Xaa-Pro aminopeptidase
MSFYKKRLDKVRQAMTQWGADILFLNFSPDMVYLTGVQTPMYYHILKGDGDWINGLLVSLDKDPVLIFQDFMAVISAESIDQTWVQDIRVMSRDEDPQPFFKKIVAEFAPEGKTIAVGKMVWSQSLLALREAAPGAQFIPATSPMMDKVREVKDEEELRLMRKAGEITEATLAATIANMHSGMTERDVAIEVEYQIKRAGGDGCSFYPGIICVGLGSDPERSIMTRNTDMVLQPGTTVAFDFGVLYKGYCTDFGRSVFVGEPNPEALRAYESIVKGSRGVVKKMGDGKMSPEQIADFVKDSVTADGFGEYYWYYGLGHAIGLEVHEAPWLRPGNKDPVKKGMCFTIEPKIWKPGEFYVRIEDVVAVGEEHGETLTKFSYEPLLIE